MSEDEKARQRPTLAVVGAGPIGLEAALAATEHGYDVTVYEAADTVAGHVDRWRHVRLFTPWSMNVSERMRHHLAEHGVEMPADSARCPTGGELIDRALQPTADLLGPRLRLGARVVAIGRRGLLKHEEISSPERAGRPFRLVVTGADGEQVEEADVVLDCSGKALANALGDGGIPALGEASLDGELSHHLPDVVHDAETWAGRATLVVGAGHSAQTAVRDLVRLAGDRPETRVIWLMRSAPPAAAEDDPLPERAGLVNQARQLATDPPPTLDVRQGRSVESIERRNGRLVVSLRTSEGDHEALGVDHVLALTGRVGDDRIYRQLQVHECYATSGPMKLAAALMASSGAGGDCLDQSSQGAEVLRNPEPGFFILGSKSYGRRNDFLLRVGFQQVDEVFELLDSSSADDERALS